MPKPERSKAIKLLQLTKKSLGMADKFVKEVGKLIEFKLVQSFKKPVPILDKLEIVLISNAFKLEQPFKKLFPILVKFDNIETFTLDKLEQPVKKSLGMAVIFVKSLWKFNEVKLVELLKNPIGKEANVGNSPKVREVNEEFAKKFSGNVVTPILANFNICKLEILVNVSDVNEFTLVKLLRLKSSNTVIELNKSAILVIPSMLLMSIFVSNPDKFVIPFFKEVWSTRGSWLIVISVKLVHVCKADKNSAEPNNGKFEISNSVTLVHPSIKPVPIEVRFGILDKLNLDKLVNPFKKLSPIVVILLQSPVS